MRAGDIVWCFGAWVDEMTPPGDREPRGTMVFGRTSGVWGLVSALFLVTCGGAAADGPGQHYKPHDPVHIVANKVGPFNNPSETYQVIRGEVCTRCRGA